MKIKFIRLTVYICLAVLVLLAITFPYQMISPGKLIDAHAELTTDCFACHTPFIGSTPDKCIACHKIEEIGKKTTKGRLIAKVDKNVAFHQQLIEQNCVSCHSDHQGVRSFRPSSQFTHKLLDAALQNRCDNCHNSPGDSLHLKAKGNCAQCHTQLAWTPATFDHEKYFRFDRHHYTECATCHVNHDYTDYTCYNCHEHSHSKIREEHIEEGINNYETCVECHRSGDEDEAKNHRKSRKRKDSRNYRYKSDDDHDDDHD